MEAPRDKQRLVISIIGWIIELIVRSIRKRKENPPSPLLKGENDRGSSRDNGITE